MANALVLKKSPVILFRAFVAIQTLGFVCYAGAVALGNYKYGLYTQLPLSGVISYQMAKLIFLFGAELLMTLYVFLRWHLETYTLTPGLAVHEWGVFFRKKKTCPLRHDMAVELSVGLLGRLLRYGAIKIKDASAKTVFLISGVSSPRRYVKTIETYSGGRNHSPALSDFRHLLAQDEHEQLEFKSSFRFDLRNNQMNRDLEKAAMKTVAGFLNSKGGNLLIGVGDNREPIGLRPDYETLKRPTSDGFENHFTQVFNAMIGPEFRHLVKLRFLPAGEHELCVVNVAPSARPVYLKLDNDEFFYVRTGNVTTPLKMSEAESYARSHWIRRMS